MKSDRPARLSAPLVAFALCLSSFAPLSGGGASATAACPVEPPSPLRTLYRESERVVVARVGATAAVEGADAENQRKTAFDVTESVKGDPGEKTLHVYHWFWQDSPGSPTNFQQGDTLLLFLRRGEDRQTDGYYVTDARYGAKKLSDADLKVYLKRIEELQWIMRQEKPDPDELVEWLVRCAEEPATRWEGAYELSVSAAMAEQEAKGKESDEAEEAEEEEDGEDDEGEAAEAEASAEEASAETAAEAAGDAGVEQPAEVVESADAAAVASGAEAQVEVTALENPTADQVEVWQGFSGSDVDASLVKHLTDEQKERLAGVLFDAETLGEGEMELLQVVGAWGDARLVPFIVKQLHKLEADPPYEAERLMYILGDVLKDRKIARLAEKYSENAPYFDEEAAEGGEGGEESAEARPEKPPAETGLVKLTHTQRRSAMLKEFIAAVEKKVDGAGTEFAQR